MIQPNGSITSGSHGALHLEGLALRTKPFLCRRRYRPHHPAFRLPIHFALRQRLWCTYHQWADERVACTSRSNHRPERESNIFGVGERNDPGTELRSGLESREMILHQDVCQRTDANHQPKQNTLHQRFHSYGFEHIGRKRGTDKEHRDD